MVKVIEWHNKLISPRNNLSRFTVKIKVLNSQGFARVANALLEQSASNNSHQTIFKKSYRFLPYRRF